MNKLKNTNEIEELKTIAEVATRLYREASKANKASKKHILLFAYNGTGKTRLSVAFKEQGKQGDKGDTLYFNAFTEDLFTWDNDLENDKERVLKFNNKSRFFEGLPGLEIESKIDEFLSCHTNFSFKINFDEGAVRFHRKESSNIKISRGEERLFIWCFFLAVVQLAIDDQDGAYKWVKYIYIDDPISSLDENNAIAIAYRLANLFKEKKHSLRAIISTHHPLFFDVLCRELGKKAAQYFLFKDKGSETYRLKPSNNIPFFYHIAMLAELQKVAKGKEIYTYHFNMLRNILEKTASFHGYRHFSKCIKKLNNDPDNVLRTRVIGIMNHSYSLYEPQEMLEENKEHFRKILKDFLEGFDFNTNSLSKLMSLKKDA